MADRRRLTAWILAGLVLFVTLASGFEIACEARHVCAGTDCRICAHISAVCGLMRILSAAVVCAAAAAAGTLLRRGAGPRMARRGSARSPVLLKVRLLN